MWGRVLSTKVGEQPCLPLGSEPLELGKCRVELACLRVVEAIGIQDPDCFFQ